MRIPRLYIPAPLHIGAGAVFDKSQAHYISKVLRLKPGAHIRLFNDSGEEFTAQLEQPGQQLQARITSSEIINNESALHSLLAQGISRADRMDYTLQKATELGVSEIQPLLMARSVIRLDEERKEKRHEHWQGVIRSAAEQCGRTRLPKLHPTQHFIDWIKLQTPDTTGLILDPRAELSLKQLSLSESHCQLLIGPEGGMDEQEIHAAKAQGFLAVRLGPRILRTETAALVALSLLQSQFGDLE